MMKLVVVARNCLDQYAKLADLLESLDNQLMNILKG